MDEKKLKALALEGIFRKAAHDNVGIYPQAVRGGDSAYENRTERMEGWNECGSEHFNNYYKAVEWFSTLPEEVKDVVSCLLLENRLDIRLDDDSCQLSVNCNDMFFWGCADGEDVAIEEIPALQECWTLAPENGTDLWISRKRCERPQGAYYTYIDEQYWPLFNACGPEREVGSGNPYRPGEYGRANS